MPETSVHVKSTNVGPLATPAQDDVAKVGSLDACLLYSAPHTCALLQRIQLEHQVMILERNVSCLYTTARLEVERKNKAIQQQRKL